MQLHGHGYIKCMSTTLTYLRAPWFFLLKVLVYYILLDYVHILFKNKLEPGYSRILRLVIQFEIISKVALESLELQFGRS